ncbi:TetR/AcrR family transcriptional regulator [Fictibacillus iocasae]|uniref:TetR/AcrR family transcriptional regulator n=1 Tax=Fictibacillus iocasae TaxID=2715437 RepID=A0ABW2NTY2_9BACL
MPKVSAEYKEEKRNAILESALRCFGQKGYQATIIDDIVADSKISKGAIYNYFSSKEEIYLQLLQKRTDEFFSSAEEEFASLPDALSKVRFLFERFRVQELTEESKQATRVYIEFWLFSSRQDDLRDVMEQRYERFISYIGNVIDEGQKSGEFKKDLDPVRMSEIFWSMRDGNVLHYSFLGDQTKYEQTWKVLEELFLQYIIK